MRLVIRNIQKILFNRRYNWLLLITTLLTVGSSLGIYWVVNDHKTLLVDYTKEKAQFMGLVVEQDVSVDILLSDINSLQNKTLRYLKKEQSLKKVSFFNLNQEKITGNSLSELNTSGRFNYLVDDDEVMLICNQTLYGNAGQEKIGYAQYSYSLTSLKEIVDGLLLKLILIALISIATINAMLLWAINEVQDKIDNEAQTKIEIETNIQRNNLQKSFLANMSHELRTPLNAINGFGELIETEVKTKQGLEWLRLIKEATSNMIFLVNDILDFSKIENNEIEFENESFDFNDLFNTICKTLEPRVSDTIYFDYSMEDSGRLIVFGDYNRVKQLLTNLITNAIKYTDEGNIKALYKYKLIDDSYYIYFEVEDTGIGIPDEKKPYIFHPFKQAHENKDRNLEGTGLGLAIVKELVNRMNGNIGFSSEVGSGSKFFFDIKLKPGDLHNYKSSVSKEEMDVHIQTNIKVLVAEDNHLNQALIKTILNNWGASVELANNGEEAVEMVSANSYDIVLMDIQMPIMGGLEATKILKNYEKSPPIIALTANAYKGSKEEYYEAGMDGYVSKPIAELKLAYQIKELLGDVIKLKSIPKGKTNFEDLDSVITEQECNIRLDSLNKLVNHDPQKINMFLGLFIKSVKEDIQIMETLFDNKEFNLINSKAHKVKPEIDLLCNEFNKNLVREIEDKEKKLTEVELKEKVEIFVEQMNKYKEDAQRLMEEFVS